MFVQWQERKNLIKIRYKKKTSNNKTGKTYNINMLKKSKLPKEDYNTIETKPVLTTHYSN